MQGVTMFKSLLAKFLVVSSYIQGKYWRSFKNRASLERWQNKKIKQFIRKLPHDNYYRTRLANLADFSEWRSWPLIDKKEMMEHFNTLNTVGMQKEEAFSVAMEAERRRDFLPQINDITVGLSSGTSGHKGLFIVSSKERYQWVGFLLAKILKKSITKRHKIALFLRANSSLYESLNSGSIQFSFFDMIKPVLSHIDGLNELNPDFLIAPPSVLRQLATLRRKSVLTINPDHIYSVAEVLDPIDENHISCAFERKVGQIYQATEGFLGVTCTHGNLHLNEDLLYIEKQYLDQNKKKFNPIITDFTRTTQPILRYLLNDILSESDSPCPCGSANLVISMIEGRNDDLVTLNHKTDKHEVVTIFPDFIRQAILRNGIELEEYLVIHHQIGCLQIALRYKNSLHPASEVEESIVQALQDMVQQHDAQAPVIEFIEYPCTDSSNLQKLKRIVRTY